MLLPQEWMKGEVVSSTPIGCMCNLPLKKTEEEANWIKKELILCMYTHNHMYMYIHLHPPLPPPTYRTNTKKYNTYKSTFIRILILFFSLLVHL